MLPAGPRLASPFEEEPPRRARTWHLSWRPLAWVAVWAWPMALVSVVSGWFGNLAGFGVLMLAVALVVWRLDRLCRRLNWTAMHDDRADARAGRSHAAASARAGAD